VKRGLILAVDPGDEHVGVAWFDKQGDAWGCVYVEEMTPIEFQAYIGPALNSGMFRYFVLESFSLYGDKAMEQTGSEMLTSQMIGMAKYAYYLAERTGVLIDLVMQQPSAKKPVFAILARKKYQFTADRLKVPGQHVRDAEVHGVKFIKDTKNWRMLKQSELWTEPLP
jgi:hypothetical protein